MEVLNEDDSHQDVGHAPDVEDLDSHAEDLEGSTSLGENSINGTFTPTSSNLDGASQAEPTEPHISTTDTTTTEAHQAGEPLSEQSDLRPPEAQIRPDTSVVRLIQEADHSAGKLVNLLAKHFPCFRDEGRFEGRKVRFLKRAQIFVADLWAAFDGTSYGEFYDIDHITMFAGKSSLVTPCTARRVIVTPESRLPGSPDVAQPRRYHVFSTVGEPPPQDGRAEDR